MRRLAALVLAHALAVSPAVVPSLHVHQYVGHDHPDHHHGPATHGHEHSIPAERHAQPAADKYTQLAITSESCDPGRHAVSVAMSCAYVSRVHVDAAEVPGPTISAPSRPIRLAVSVTDVRVHGPPFDPRIPSRAPPVIPHA